MKLNRSKNILKGTIVGVINTVITTLLQFANRTVMIYILGTEYLGLGNLFSSILSVLSLAELGFSSAIIYFMYKPIAEDDDKTVCSLLRFYKIVYYIVGTVILIVGLILIPFLPKLINGSYPEDINLTTVYLLYLGNTVLSYYAGAYKQCILVALQRNDVQNAISLLTNVLKYGGQILVLILLRNFYAYSVLIPLATLVSNIYTVRYTSKKYPQFKPKGKLNNTLKIKLTKKISSLFVFKVGETVISSVDSIVISAYLGLTILAQYNNYYYIISALITFFGIYVAAILSPVGNSIVTESMDKNYRDFKTLLLLQAWIVGWCSICLVVLFQPFIQIWVGKDNVLDFRIVILLAISFYIWKIQDVVFVYKNAKGLWEQDKWRTVITAGLNLVLSLALVSNFGLEGVILGTIISRVLIEMPWGTYVLFDNYFKKSEIMSYFKLMILYTFISICIGCVTWFSCSIVGDSNIVSFIIKVVMCCVIPNVMYITILSRFDSYTAAISLLKKAIAK